MVTGADQVMGVFDGAEVLEGEPAADTTPSAAGETSRGIGGTDAAAQPDETRPVARQMGYSVAQMNEHYALVMLGSRAMVFHHNANAPLEERYRFLTFEAFGHYFANRVTEVVASDGKVRVMTWANRWRSDPGRRSYDGVEFFPDPDNAPGTPGYLNLWSGFAVTPRPPGSMGRGSYTVFRDHLLNNVARGDPAIDRWVFAFFAQMLQKPRERAGVALVMRGVMGCGKTKVGEVFGSLIPQHYFLVDDPRYVTGQFNAHMAKCLLLQADEAVWAGDKAAEGRLKGLITSPIQQIEAKGVDPIRLDNYVRVVMTSNDEWVVPAGKDERRFCVLDVHPRCAKNHDYFGEMEEELNAGGREALLADLLSFDLGSVNLRQIPHTRELANQKLRSLNSAEAWWYERLFAGVPCRKLDLWPRDFVAKETLFDDYYLSADRVGIRRKSSETEIGQMLDKFVPGLISKKRPVEHTDFRGDVTVRRKNCWLFPPLADCRAAFDEKLQQPLDWPPLDDDTDAVERPAIEGVEDL